MNFSPFLLEETPSSRVHPFVVFSLKYRLTKTIHHLVVPHPTSQYSATYQIEAYLVLYTGRCAFLLLLRQPLPSMGGALEV